MINLDKKNIISFAKKVVEQSDFVFSYVSDCGKMKVEITEECPVISRVDVENSIVQINPLIAKKYRKSAMIFFIVWGFLKEREKSDLQTDNETMSLLTQEIPNWCVPLNSFMLDFCDILSYNMSNENKDRCRHMIEKQFLND